MLKIIIIAISVFVAVGIIEIVYFIARAVIKGGVNQLHEWEENPDKAESEAGNDTEA